MHCKSNLYAYDIDKINIFSDNRREGMSFGLFASMVINLRHLGYFQIKR
jgi:hypothetical protein